MLTPLDDYLAHQIPDTFDHVGTSDRNFFDRYYFNAHPCGDELLLIFGIGQYPNLGVTDAYAALSYKGIQHVVRSSRELGSNRLDTKVGPISVEVLEGLRRFHCVCEPNQWGIEYDLTWEAAVPAALEPHSFNRQFARVISDSCRLTQTGFWTGTIKVAGETFRVTPNKWWGSRDHSWGIRPVGEPEPLGIRASLPSRGRLHNWATMQFPDYTILYFIGEEGDGTRTFEEAVRLYPFETGREMEHLGHPRHEIEFKSGTRELKRATIYFTEPSGKELPVRVEPLRTMYLSAGTGYGNDPDWRHGTWQGPLKVEGLQYDITAPAVRARISGLNDCNSRYELDGQVGYGIFEMSISGHYLPYGFKTATDVAP